MGRVGLNMAENKTASPEMEATSTWEILCGFSTKGQGTLRVGVAVAGENFKQGREEAWGTRSQVQREKDA